MTDVPDPTIEQPTDAIVRITSTAICGSDLHLYEVLGAVPHPRRRPRPRADGHRRGGRPRGHPPQRGRPGRRAVQHLLRLAAGCARAACTPSARPRRCASRARAPRCSATPRCTASVPGGQARVPAGAAGPVRPDQGAATAPDERFLFLSDILPTAWQAVALRRRARAAAPSRSSGSGPVGQFAARIGRAPRRRAGHRRRPGPRAARAWPRHGDRGPRHRRRRRRRRRPARDDRRPRPGRRDRRRRHGGARLAASARPPRPPAGLLPDALASR